MTDSNARPNQEDGRRWMHRQGEIIDDILLQALFEACLSDVSLLDNSKDRGQSLETVRAIFDARPTLDLNKEIDGTTPLIASIVARNVDVTKLLLKHGANPNYETTNSKNPAEVAIRSTQQDMLDLLIKHGAKVDDIVPSFLEQHNVTIQGSPAQKSIAD